MVPFDPMRLAQLFAQGSAQGQALSQSIDQRMRQDELDQVQQQQFGADMDLRMGNQNLAREQFAFNQMDDNRRFGLAERQLGAQQDQQKWSRDFSEKQFDFDKQSEFRREEQAAKLTPNDIKAVLEEARGLSLLTEGGVLRDEDVDRIGSASRRAALRKYVGVPPSQYESIANNDQGAADSIAEFVQLRSSGQPIPKEKLAAVVAQLNAQSPGAGTKFALEMASEDRDRSDNEKINQQNMMADRARLLSTALRENRERLLDARKRQAEAGPLGAEPDEMYDKGGAFTPDAKAFTSRRNADTDLANEIQDLEAEYEVLQGEIRSLRSGQDSAPASGFPEPAQGSPAAKAGESPTTAKFDAGQAEAFLQDRTQFYMNKGDSLQAALEKAGAEAVARFGSSKTGAR